MRGIGHAEMAICFSLLPLLCCVLAIPLDDQQRHILYNDELAPGLNLLIPPNTGEQQPAAPSSYDYRNHRETKDIGFYSNIPSEYFVMDDMDRILTGSDTEEDKKTVKKDLSNFGQEAVAKASHVRFSHSDDDSFEDLPLKAKNNHDYYIQRCQEILQDPLSTDELLHNLCLLHSRLKKNSRVKRKLISNENKPVYVKRVTPNMLETLLGSSGAGEGDGNIGGNFFVSGNKLKAQLGNLALNGHGGFAGNLGVGGKGTVGNVGVAGKGGLYGNLAVGGKGALFGNLGVSGVGGEYDNAYAAADPWTTKYTNDLLGYLLSAGFSNYLGAKPEENSFIEISEPTPVKFPENVGPGQAAAETTEKVLVKIGAGDSNGFFEQLDDINAVPFVSENFGPSKFPEGHHGADYVGGVVTRPHASQDLDLKYLFKNKEYTKGIVPELEARLRHQMKAGRALNGQDRCALTSLLINGRGGVVGNLAIGGYNFGKSSADEAPCMRVYSFTLVDPKAKVGLDGGRGEDARPAMNKYRQMSGRREWTSIGGNDRLYDCSKVSNCTSRIWRIGRTGSVSLSPLEGYSAVILVPVNAIY